MLVSNTGLFSYICPSAGPDSVGVEDKATRKTEYRRYPFRGFPGGSGGKASACNARDPSSIPGSGRSPGEGNGNLLQYSCLENPMDGGDCLLKYLISLFAGT